MTPWPLGFVKASLRTCGLSSPSQHTADGLSPYATEYPFTLPPVQPQQYQYIPQRLPPPPQISSFASNPMQSFPSATTAAARAYAYTPISSATPVYPPSRPTPAGQGMRMIHYVAPGSSTTSTTSPAVEPRPPSTDSSNQQPSKNIPKFPPGGYYKSWFGFQKSAPPPSSSDWFYSRLELDRLPFNKPCCATSLLLFFFVLQKFKLIFFSFWRLFCNHIFVTLASSILLYFFFLSQISSASHKHTHTPTYGIFHFVKLLIGTLTPRRHPGWFDRNYVRI